MTKSTDNKSKVADHVANYDGMTTTLSKAEALLNNRVHSLHRHMINIRNDPNDKVTKWRFENMADDIKRAREAISLIEDGLNNLEELCLGDTIT